MTTAKPDNEDLQVHGYATGNYSCRCTVCQKEFIGHKRSYRCRKCAVSSYAKFHRGNYGKTTNTVETEPTKPFTADDLHKTQAALRQSHNEQVEEAAKRLFTIIKTVGEITMMPSTHGMQAGGIVIFVHPDVYARVKDMSADEMKKAAD